MIAKSDIVILLVATTALGVSVLRWSAVQPDAPRTTGAVAPPSSSVPAGDRSPVPAVSLDNAGEPAGSPSVNQASGTVRELPSAGSPANAPSSTTNPGTDNEPNAETVQNATNSGDGTGVHTVVSGDSLGVIANRYDTTVLELQVINGIEGTTIYVGQELRYPLASN